MSRKLSLFLLSALILLLSAGLTSAQGDDTALVRVVLMAVGAPDQNIVVDGDVVGTATSSAYAVYVNLTPGAHRLSMVPASGGAAGAKGKPLSLNLKAGDQHMVYAVWATLAKKSLALHDVNEKAILEAADGDDGAFIYIHGILGAPPIDVITDGQKVVSNLAYGDYASFTAPPSNVDDWEITAAGNPNTAIFDTGVYFLEPHTLWTEAMTGTYPGTMWQDYTYYYYDALVNVNASDFLGSFDAVDVGPTNFGADYDYATDEWKFDTFLKLINDAGFSDLLAAASPLTVFAPTDAAFDRLPAGTLDAILADRDLMEQVVENHIAQSMTPMSDDMLDTPITMMNGQTVTLSYNADNVFQINGENRGCNCSYNVTNGRVYVLDQVLIPEGLDIAPMEPATAEPTSEATVEPTATPEVTAEPTAEATIPAETATVVLYNATWMDSIDLYVDGSAAFTGNSRGAQTERFDVAAGTHTLEITYNGDNPESVQLRLAEATIEPNHFYLVMASGFNYIEGSLGLYDLGPVPQPGETVPGQVLLINKLIGPDGLTLAFDRSPLVENVSPFSYGLADVAKNKYQKWQMLDSATGDELIHGATYVGDPALTLPDNSVEVFMIEGEYPGVDGNDYQWWWLTVPTGAVTQTDGGAIEVGQSIDVELVAGERVRYTLTLDEDTEINVLLTGATRDQDAYLRVFNTAGELFYQNDELSGADNSYDAGLYRSTLAPGTYTIEVASWNDNEPGAYTLSVEDAGPIPNQISLTEEPTVEATP